MESNLSFTKEFHPAGWSSDGFLIKNGFPVIRFHDLRHTNATLMLKNKIPAKIVSERLGHSNISITLDVYSHVANDMQKEASEILDMTILK